MASEDHSDKGFLNSSLAYFDINHFQNTSAPIIPSEFNVTHCRYVFRSFFCYANHLATLTHYFKFIL